MDNKREGTTPRRRLPSPNVSAQGSESAANDIPVPPTNFYSSNKPPPLPSRPIAIPTGSAGSSHTRYHPPPSSPTGAGEGTPFREPELVADEPISDEEAIPALISQDRTHPQQQSAWYDGPDHFGSKAIKLHDASSWSESGNWSGAVDESAWSGGIDHVNWASNFVSKKVRIDGTDDEEEQNWWDAAVREKHRRPGPGVLPPVLEDSLHNPDHSLFSVIVDPSDSTRFEATLGPSTGPSRAVAADISRSSSQSLTTDPRIHSTFPPSSPPSAEDLIHAVPHPNAYYCRRHNGWVILQWKESTVLPPLANSFREDPQHPLPDQSRRKKTHSCIEGEPAFGQGNKTHHFHLYEKAVSAHKLTPAFYRQKWEMVDKVKQRRRKMTTSVLSIDNLSMNVARDDKMDEDTTQDEDDGDLLDLWVCCQCSLYCVASDVIPGVIPLKSFEEFTRNRHDNPVIGKNGEESVVIGWETLLTVLENKLWKGEDRVLPIGRKGFQKKVGWNTNVQRVFEALGFKLDEAAVSTRNDTGAGPALFPPQTLPTTSEGRQNRAKLLRAWVEISAWLVDYLRRQAPALKAYTPHKLYVSLTNAREMYQTALGAHNAQIPRGLLTGILVQYQPDFEAWTGLGLTPTSYSPELLAFAYMAQCRCDPAHTPKYFDWFFRIIQAMQDLQQDIPPDLQSVVMDERSRFRYTHQDLDAAIKCLGFGNDGPLSIEFDEEVSEEFIVNAWKDKVRRAWRDPRDGAEIQREANVSFRIIAEERGSVALRKLWEDNQGRTMNPDRAYSTLEIPAEVDDDMVLTVFSLRIDEQPSQCDKMREALSIIAELRDSARLRQFLETGTDPGEIIPPTRSDLPRGLNQLGNTCYLNSLLQYFYTIKELREAVAPMANADQKLLDDEKVSDDALKQHRVGGRLVTRREVGRSKKFVSQLADLFWQLEYLQTASVTPTIELAKLALVTSRDEEEDEVGTDSSNDTDATLVEDAPARILTSEPSRHSPLRSPNSVLGKRPRRRSEMDVDSPAVDSERDKDAFVIVSNPTSPLRSSTPPAEGSSSKPEDTPQPEEIIDVDMPDGSGSVNRKISPSLPPRKTAATSDSSMMFGKQHDVSECMDNCMFQIETALLKFDRLSGSNDGKGSIVKRLFYGKIRQRLATVSLDNKSRASVHEKEDLFSNLPVNVAEDGFDLYDGLSGYFDDIVEFEGKKARMEVSLVELPPLLQVQLQRVQFNRETLQPYKSQAYVKFGEAIYMDRFLDGADPPKKARSKVIQTELTNCRERINILSHGKHAPFAAALNSTLSFLSQQEGVQVDEDLKAQLSKEQDFVKAEVDELRSRVVKLKEELESIWITETNACYELTSVFVHRGASPSWGHYFFYSRNLPDQPDTWFKYNDSDVTEVSKDEVLADTTGSTANPYLLVFARKGSEVIQTVNRFDPDNLVEADA